ncbi:peptidoglycan/xylan/chitin deacetylase (PgdA/CDA1 family) [Clostridiales Family XIII bacterium PM5-7]
MDSRFTVKFFKRVITFTVIGIILALAVTVIAFGMQLSGLKENQKSLLEQLETNGSGELPNASTTYQKKYKKMFVKREKVADTAEKNTVYLTFDDGPSSNTIKVLDVLKKHDIKATFFVVYQGGEQSQKILQRIIDEGHTIGIHSYSHDYEKIYQSVDAYLKDFYRLWSYIDEEFGYQCKVFRFPGGSINTYNLNVYDLIAPEMYRRGFTFYDWNVSAEDATSNHVSASSIESAIVAGVRRNESSVVLMHDSVGMDATVAALPKVIKRLKADGYAFKTLDNSVMPLTFMN